MIGDDIQIPGYDLSEHVAQGGMSSVFRARQHIFDRDVALKIMRQDLGDDSHFNERFIQESLIVAKLHHSHIVQVYDVGEVSEHCFIAMEFLSGGALKAKMAHGISVKMSVSILKQIASALDFAHQKGIVHRDIKPDNIMFREDGAAVLTDFGIAKDSSVDMELTQAGAIMGTPKYMAPEQIKNQAIGPAADLYSLGVVFFEMLTGFAPFPGNDFVTIAHKHLNDPIPSLPGHLAHFQRVIDKLLAKTPEERFARASEIYLALDKIAEQTPHPEVDETVVATAEQLDFGSLVSSGENTKQRTGVQKAKDIMAKPQAIGIAASVVTVIMAMTIYQWLFAEHEQPQFTSTAESSLPTTGDINSQATPAQPPSAAQNTDTERRDDLGRIQLLLVSAKTDILNDRLTRPEGNNALEKFQQILTLDPGHTEAQAGIVDISRRYAQLGMSRLQAKDSAAAQIYLNQAQTIYGDLAEVRQLASAIEQFADAENARKEKILSMADQLRIDGLMDMAQREEREGRISAAIERYQQVLKINPDHAEAKNKMATLQ